jgi:hypothetical protein
MNKIIALIATILALSACGSIPTAADREGNAATGASRVEPVTAEAGLGTVVYDDKTRANPCKKVRRTGSRQFITKCDDPDGGSQPVRYGGWNDLGQLVMSGAVRPESY